MGETPTNSSVSKFWAELQRRRVVRVVVLYAIAGWIVIEVASTVLPNLNLPEWTVTLVTALVVLGFIIAIMLAWAFDIVPDGVQRTAGTEPSAETNFTNEEKIDTQPVCTSTSTRTSR